MEGGITVALAQKAAMKSYAIPGQKPRPALDAAFAHLEALSKKGCGVCGSTDPMVRWNGSAYIDPETGEMTPWMCLDCRRAYLERKGDTNEP